MTYSRPISRYADPDRDAAALVRAWGYPRQPDYGPLIMIHDVREAPPRMLRTKRYERRLYDGLPVTPLTDIPTTMPHRDAVLPKEQLGWELVSEQVYRTGSSGHYVVRIRHVACGTTRHIYRSAWLKGRAMGRQCQRCFKPDRLAMIPMSRKDAL